MKKFFPFTDNNESDGCDYDDSVLDAILGVGLAVGAGYILHKTIGKIFKDNAADADYDEEEEYSDESQDGYYPYSNSRSQYSSRNQGDDWANGRNTNEQRSNGYSDEMIHHLAVLRLKPGATLEDARRAYRELSKKFHPDVISGKGLDEEFVRFSTKRFQEI